MPRSPQCSVCQHAEVVEIDRLIVTREVQQNVLAKRYGLSAQALIRHRASHLPPALVGEVAQAEGERGSGLLVEVQAIHDRTLAILARAEKEENHTLALKAIREARQTLELAARLRGEIAEPTINLVLTPQFTMLQAHILAAVDGHPDAKAKIVQAMMRLAGPG